MVLVALGFAVLIFGGGMKAVTVIGLLIAAFNLGYELVFPILNIPDFADAVAGFLGIAIAYAFLLSPQIAITSWTLRGKNLGHGWSRRIYP